MRRATIYALVLALLTGLLCPALAMAEAEGIATTAVTVKPRYLSLNPNTTYRLTVVIAPKDADDGLVWSSSDETVATVTQKGTVRAHAPGTANIVATAGSGVAAACVLTVKPVPVKSVALNRSTATLGLNVQYQFTATVKPTTATDKTITWRSSVPAVATIDQNGLLSTLSEGTTFVYATSANGVKARCRVLVKAIRVTGIKLNYTSVKLNKGATLQLSASIKPATATYPTVEYTSSDEAIATVDENGLVTALAAGTAKITAAVDKGRKKAVCTVKVLSGESTPLVISAIGDITLGGDPRDGSEARYASLLKGFGGDYGAFFQNVSDTLKSDDLTIANLECVITTASSHASKAYVFRAKPAYVNILKKAGIDVLAIDNNHTLDFNNAGFASTRSALSGAGFGYCGRGYTYVKTVKGVKVGFCGFYTQTSSLSSMKRIVAKMNEKCDIVVASFHWGTEYVYRADSQQIAYGRAAVQAGADLVVGHHSHVVSGIEKYRGRYIVYSLGTFSSCIKLPADTDTYIFQQTFNIQDGSITLGDIKVIPCSMTSSSSVNNAQPKPLDGAGSERVKKKIRTYSAAFPTPADI